MNTLQSFILILLVLSLLLVQSNSQSYAKDDLTSLAEVVRVVDGDTIIVKGLEGFKRSEEFRVRLADINAPELSTEEGIKAKEYMNSLFKSNGSSTVLLDIDDKYIYDRYGRVVAVVYIITKNQNDGHYTLVNVNQLLVKEGYAFYYDYSNEFNPNNWVEEIDCYSTSPIGADILRCIPDLPIPIIILSTAMVLSILFVYMKRIHLGIS